MMLELEVLDLAVEVLRSLSDRAPSEPWAEHLEALADQIADVIDLEDHGG